MTAIEQARILILATDGFGEAALFRPRERLKDLGAEVQIASLARAPIQAEAGRDQPISINADLALDQVDPERFDALLIPGGNANCCALCRSPEAVGIVRRFARSGKPVAAGGEGRRLLVEAALVAPEAETVRGLACEGNLLTCDEDMLALADALVELIANR